MRWLAVLLSMMLPLSCGSDDAPRPPPEDVPQGFDVRIDLQSPRDTALPDRAVEDRGPDPCQPGSFVPCECSVGNLGIRRCVAGMIEPVCRCGDAGADDADMPRDGGMDAARE